jgi:hypothetical protein
MQLVSSSNKADTQKVTSLAMACNFYPDLHTSTVTADDIARVLKESPHCAIMEGPSVHLTPMTRRRILAKMFGPGKEMDGFNYTWHEFVVHCVLFTRVGVCGNDVAMKDKLRFHMTISDDELASTVRTQRKAMSFTPPVGKLQASFNAALVKAVTEKLTEAQVFSGAYQVDIKLEYEKDSHAGSEQLVNDAKFLGIYLRECIMYGHKSITIKTGYVQGSADVHIRETTLCQEPGSKRQKLHPHGGTLCEEQDSKRQKK